MSNQDHAHALPSGFMLEEYQIERVLGAGGFGITYYARDTHLNKAVAIKEYMPSDCAARYDEATVAPRSSSDAGNYDWGLTRFLEEARVLAGFDHPNINRVHRRLEAHGTAYIVLEYLSGKSLSDRLKRTGRLSPDEVWRLFNELLSGLAEVHRQDYVHRDIKPGNIMFREDGGAVLLDFGAARQAIGQRTRSITTILTPFYAPPEQYDLKGHDVGPWSDFYALGVVAYRCVTGVGEGELLDAVARERLAARGKGEEDMRPAVELAGGEYDRRLLEAIDWCMRVDERERPQEVVDLEAALAGGPLKEEEKPEPVPKPNPAPPPDPDPAPPESGRFPGWLTGSLAFVFAFFVLVVLPSIGTKPKPIPPPAGLEVFRDALKDGGRGPEMVVLPTGRFRMGDLSGGGFSEEKPVRSVTISRPIAMGKYEVSFAEYDRFARATGRVLPDDEGWGRGNRPVVNVSQEDAKAYAAWLSAQTGKRYRLPSEAEWEYAARAGTTTKYSWGNKIGRNRANCDGCGSFWHNVWKDIWSSHQTVRVGSFAANLFGLHDMHGNVSEWVEDCWHDNYEGAPSDGRAWTTGCDDNLEAVVRGDSWLRGTEPWRLRSAYRDMIRPSRRDHYFGFRLVQDLNP